MNDFIKEKIVMDGLTYDDVLLIPAYSEVLPKGVSLKTKFSRNIELNVPFVTAGMMDRLQQMVRQEVLSEISMDVRQLWNIVSIPVLSVR